MREPGPGTFLVEGLSGLAGGVVDVADVERHVQPAKRESRYRFGVWHDQRMVGGI